MPLLLIGSESRPAVWQYALTTDTLRLISAFVGFGFPLSLRTFLINLRLLIRGHLVVIATQGGSPTGVRATRHSQRENQSDGHFSKCNMARLLTRVADPIRTATGYPRANTLRR